jgi:hypothetical protein
LTATSAAHDDSARAHTADVIARGRGIGVNALLAEALEAEIERVREDKSFHGSAARDTERDRGTLDRLARR